MSLLDQPVWYVAFGSNLYRPRLLAYLEGTEIPGSPTGQRESGARDPTPPSDDGPHPLDHQLYFANHSKRWGGGGAAFVDPASNSPSATLGRRYLITWGQLEDILRQENGADVVEPLDLVELKSAGRLHRYSGWYDTLLYCGDHTDGAPMATITSDVRRPDNPPSTDYLAVISKGLMQLGYSDADISSYLDRHAQPT